MRSFTRLIGHYNREDRVVEIRAQKCVESIMPESDWLVAVRLQLIVEALKRPVLRAMATTTQYDQVLRVIGS
jgi:hypothetical protein